MRVLLCTILLHRKPALPINQPPDVRVNRRDLFPATRVGGRRDIKRAAPRCDPRLPRVPRARTALAIGCLDEPANQHVVAGMYVLEIVRSAAWWRIASSFFFSPWLKKEYLVYGAI